MKDYRVEYHWANGFVEKFTCAPTAKTAREWLENGKGLDSVVRIVVTDSKGEVIYDVKKESPYVAPQKEDGSSNRTQKKKTVRKKTRTKTG
jgi:hypothetical protein